MSEETNVRNFPTARSQEQQHEHFIIFYTQQPHAFCHMVGYVNRPTFKDYHDVMNELWDNNIIAKDVDMYVHAVPKQRLQTLLDIVSGEE